MLYPLFGTPSSWSQWSLHLVAQIATVVHGEKPFVLPCVYLKELRDNWGKREGRACVLFSDVPEHDLAQVLLNSRAMSLVVHDDPIDALNFTMAARKLDLRTSMRFISQSYATLEDLFAAPTTTIIGPRHGTLPLRAFIPLVAHAYERELQPAQIDAVLETMIGTGGAGSSETVADNIARHRALVLQGEGLQKDDEALARSFLGQYAGRAGQALDSIDVPIDLLHHWDHMGTFLSAETPIELTGPVRILTAGHTFHLPPGAWNALVEIEVLENISGNRLACDILVQDDSVAGISAPLPQDGRYYFNVDFSVDDGFKAIQLRMVLEEGAIEGRLIIHRLMLRRSVISVEPDPATSSFGSG